MEEERLKNYVTISREIVSDCRNGKLSIPERNLLFWLRVTAGPYGVSHCDLDLLSRETFNAPVTKSYINKLVLSLKGKKYIWYEERQGRRGSFEVHLDDWARPDKSIKRLDRYFEGVGVRSEDVSADTTQSKARPEVGDESQKIEERKRLIREQLFGSSRDSLVRSSDTDTHTDKENDDTSLQLRKENFAIEDFVPQSAEEQRCVEIAIEVGEESAGFVIGILRKHGLKPIEDAFMEYQTKDLTKLNNPKGLFNSLVMDRTNLY